MRAVIVANGLFTPGPATTGVLAAASLVVAADGGADHCLAQGRTPDILLGDLDSISPKARAACAASGVQIQQLPVDKDASDLEFSLDLAGQLGASDITLLGALGGRWDMTLANILLAGSSKFRHLTIRLLDGDSCLDILHPPGPHRISGWPGQTVSFLPLGGGCRRVNLDGFHYPLREKDIAFGSSLGVSNRLTDKVGEVRLEGGILLAIRLACR